MIARRVIWVAVSVLLGGFALSGCSDDKSSGSVGERDCTNGTDDDWDRLADCADPDCANDVACGGPGPGVESNCTNGLDDDADGSTDCDDRDCATLAACNGGQTETDCANGIDDDADGSTDCDDRDCVGVGSCLAGGTCSLATCCYANTDTVALPNAVFAGELSATDQTDGPRGSDEYLDDIEFSGVAGEAVTIEIIQGDFDTYLYLLDENCEVLEYDDDGGTGSLLSQIDFTLPYTGVYTIVVTAFSGDDTGAYSLTIDSAMPAYEVVCDDSVDNDADGDTDCDDYDCASNPACLSYEADCSDLIDNDSDGDTDCADPDCAGDPACGTGVETDCSDLMDNDSDGYTDCSDPDCASHPDCAVGVETDCSDLMDNDSDGYTDCADPDCAGDASCVGGPELVCNDVTDNDSDSYTDCADPDCTAAPNCMGTCSLGTCCMVNTGVVAPTGDTVVGALDLTDQTSGPRGDGYRYDEYEFPGTAGQSVTIELTDGAFDTYLYLLDSTCQVVEYDDDGGSGTLSMISSYVLPTSGVYSIVVANYSSSSTGAYTLQLTAP